MAAAASYFSGTAFMPTQRAGPATVHDCAASGAATPSASKSRNNTGYSGCVPGTLRHISCSLAAAASADGDGDHAFSIDGFNFRVLGKVETAVSGETDVSFRLDEGTGKIPLVRWITDEADAQNAAYLKAGVYVRVHMDITGFQANQQGYARFIRPTTNFNEVVLHFIECIHVHMQNTGPKMQGTFPPGVQANAYTEVPYVGGVREHHVHFTSQVNQRQFHPTVQTNRSTDGPFCGGVRDHQNHQFAPQVNQFSTYSQQHDLQSKVLKVMQAPDIIRIDEDNNMLHCCVADPLCDDVIGSRKRKRTTHYQQSRPLHRNHAVSHGIKNNGYPVRKPVEIIQIQDLKRRILLGTRSKFDAKNWTCPKCLWVNRPHKHLVAHLPPLFCERPGCKFDLIDLESYEFSFSMGDVTLNGHSPIGNIKDQKLTDLCTLHTTTLALEITERMSTILNGEEPEGRYNEGPILNVGDLHVKTLDLMKTCNINQGPAKYTYKISLVAFEVATSEGIEELKQEKKVLKTVKAAGKELGNLNFASIISRIADGIPQVASILPGKKFDQLKYGQIYKAPKRPSGSKHGKKIIWHSVVLIGGGKRRRQYFFEFANSHNIRFCLRIPVALPRRTPWFGGVYNGKAKKFPGGIGKVRAADALNVYPLEFIKNPSPSASRPPWVSKDYCIV